MEERKKSNKIEIWQETVDQEKITVIKTERATTRINRKKLIDAMEKIISDPVMRAKLEANPAETMVEMGIEIDDDEKAILAGKKLSESLAKVSEERIHIPETAAAVIITTQDTPFANAYVDVLTDPGVSSSMVVLV